MPFPPTQPHVRSLWAPSPIYETDNARQRRPLAQLYNSDARTNDSKRVNRGRDAPSGNGRYGYTRDITNVLRGTTSRMVWDYQAESMTLSEEEQEYELQLEAVKNYGYSWMVPEGKAMNQEEEADDELISEETRVAAAAAVASAAVAAVQEQRDRQMAAVNAALASTGTTRRTDEEAREDVEDSMEGPSRQSRTTRRAGDGRRVSGGVAHTNPASTTADGRRRSGGRPSTDRRSSGQHGATSTATAPRGARPPSSRDSAGNASNRAPRASGRYSVSSAGSARDSGAAALPRYIPATVAARHGQTPSVSSSGPSSVPMSSGPGDLSIGSAGGRDLDAEIPEAEEASYGGDGFYDVSGATHDLSGENDEGRDLDADISDFDSRHRRQGHLSRPSPIPPFPGEGESFEDATMADSVDMDVSS